MMEQNRRTVWNLIQKQGDILKDKLSYHPYHPKGRNSYAHICSLIYNKFNCSYKDVPDEKIQELKNFILGIKD